MGNIATTDLKWITIIQKEYAPPVDHGSKILLNLSDSSCAYFNRQVFTNLDKALTLEQKYELLGPKLMLQDSEYPTYKPVGIFSII